MLLPSANCNQIIPNEKNLGAIYIGNLFFAEDIELLKKNQIKSVISCLNNSKITYDESIIEEHYIIPIDDDESFEILSLFETTFKIIEDVRKRYNVLVHCEIGVSRSASIVIAYLMKKKKWSFDDSFKFVKGKRNHIDPNKGFISQLQEYEFLLTNTRK